MSLSTLSIHWFFMVSKCSYAAWFPGFFSKIRAAEVTYVQIEEVRGRESSDRHVQTRKALAPSPGRTCGVSSLACFTAAWMPSTVPLLADPTAAAFSAVAPRRPA